MRNTFAKLKLAVLLLPFLAIFHVTLILDAQEKSAEVRNVIIMIPDGMSAGGYTLSRWFQGAKPLAMDKLVCGIVKTCSSDSVIPDSAAAATAYATGFKTHTRYLGVLPEVSDMPVGARLPKGCGKIPVGNVMEAARLKGISTGMVCTVEIMHATPAGFSAHYPGRNNFEVIGEQQVFSGFDVIMGGGYNYLLAEKRADKEDLLSEISGQGYELVRTPEEMKNSSAKKLWCVFADTDMSFEIDRDGSSQPSLAEMTEKAIELLSTNKKGFLLMVEGSKIDYAAHAHDPVALVNDIVAFDKAVAKALEFAQKSGDTAIIIVPDHGNGGITIGNASISGNYDSTRPEDFISPLVKAKSSAAGVCNRLGTMPENEKIKKVFAEEYSIGDLSGNEIAEMKDSLKENNGKACGILNTIINSRAKLGWAANGHIGEDVLLFAYSPGWRPEGTIDSTDVAFSIQKLLGLSLKEASLKLFRDALYELEKAGAHFKVDNGDGPNPVLTVVENGEKIEFPASRNYAIESGRRIPFDYGQTIYNGVKWYFPICALELVLKEK